MTIKRRPPEGNVRRACSIGNNLRGVVTSKTGRIVQFESFAERTLLLCLDRDRTVRDYNSQPETFEFYDPKGKKHRYTPDFIVWRTNGNIEVHEVTRTERQTRDSIRLRETAAEHICAARGWTYVIHTEATLPQGTELANLLGLLAYRPMGYAQPAVWEAVRSYLGEHVSEPWERVTAHLSQTLPLSQVSGALLHFLWHTWLGTDFQQALWNNGTVVSKTRLWLSEETNT